MPSIAVLPFDNLSNDPNEDHLSDGLTEDIITDLAKISGMFVIARHSSFRYKCKAVDVQQVGRELGVRYLLEGSVRKGGNKVRINAQLIDAVNGNHLWSERYDLEQKDLFNVQNKLLEKKYDRAIELRGRAHSSRPNGADSNALLALTLSLVGREEEALPYIKTAMRLSPFYSSWYLGTLCDIFRLMGRHEEAIATSKAIIELNQPAQIEVGRIYLAAILIELGRDEEAQELAAEYRKLRPTNII